MNSNNRDSDPRPEAPGQLELGIGSLSFDLELPPPWNEGLRRAQAEMIQKAPKGTICPCCGRKVKIYVYPLHGSMVAALIWFVQEAEAQVEGTWIAPQREARRKVLASRSYPKLAHWGLLEARPNPDDPTKRCKGQWRPTPLGVRFANDEIQLPEDVVVFKNRKIGQSRRLIGVRDALGVKFSYEKLMGTDPTFREG